MIIPGWIAWTVLFAGLMALIATALIACAFAVFLIQVRRDAAPAQQLHRLGQTLMDSRDRERARMGFDLIGFAHTLDPTGCRCPQMAEKRDAR